MGDLLLPCIFGGTCLVFMFMAVVVAVILLYDM